MIKISPQTTNKKLFRSNNNFNKGLTLIEIVIVVAILAFITTLAIPRLSNQKSQMRAAVRKMGVSVREIKNSAKLNRATYRLVIQMPDPDSARKEPTRFWVESTPGNVLVSSEEEEEELDELEEDEEDPSPSRFKKDTRIVKDTVELPNGLNITSVQVANRDEAIEGGTAYIYFLPEGYVTQTVVQFSGGDNLRWTLALAPITGKVDVFPKEVSLKELQR